MVSDRAARKRWPVDPAEFPLTGPSSGPVYVPPQDEPTPTWVKVFWGVILAFAAYCGFLAIVVVSYHIGTMFG